MKTIVLIITASLALAVNASAQNDPYGKVDSKNLGNISRQDYEMSVLSTFRQNVPRIETGVDIKNYSDINIHSFQDLSSAAHSAFERYDFNRDALISREEYGRMGGIADSVDFDTIDINGDGYISHDELTQGLLLKARKEKNINKEPEKSARQKHDEANPTLRVLYDETEGYYVK